MSLGVIVGGILMIALGLFNLAGAVLPRHRLLHGGLWWRIGTGTGPSELDRMWMALVGIGFIGASVYLIALSR